MKHYLLSIEQPDVDRLDPAQRDPVLRAVAAFHDELRAVGALVFAGGLDRAETSVVVRFHGDDVVTTDGPYEREEEHAGGICVVAAPDYDAAIEWGRRLARATTLPVEVREFQGEPGAHLP
ncbi:MAG: YciI family protein [Actinomycetota bacterium]